jgi:hypothetical protein
MENPAWTGASRTTWAASCLYYFLTTEGSTWNIEFHLTCQLFRGHLVCLRHCMSSHEGRKTYSSHEGRKTYRMWSVIWGVYRLVTMEVICTH